MTTVFSEAEEVIKYYPMAKPKATVNSYVIESGGYILGRGKNKRCAWASAYKNLTK